MRSSSFACSRNSVIGQTLASAMIGPLVSTSCESSTSSHFSTHSAEAVANVTVPSVSSSRASMNSSRNSFAFSSLFSSVVKSSSVDAFSGFFSPSSFANDRSAASVEVVSISSGRCSHPCTSTRRLRQDPSVISATETESVPLVTSTPFGVGPACINALICSRISTSNSEIASCMLVSSMSFHFGAGFKAMMSRTKARHGRLPDFNCNFTAESISRFSPFNVTVSPEDTQSAPQVTCSRSAMSRPHSPFPATSSSSRPTNRPIDTSADFFSLLPGPSGSAG